MLAFFYYSQLIVAEITQMDYKNLCKYYQGDINYKGKAR